jgi:hypothetical protein
VGGLNIGRKRGTLLAAALAFGLAASPARGAWTVIAENDQIRVYADKATIRRQGSIVTMWSLMDYRQSQLGKNGSYLSSKGHDEYDCSLRRTRLLVTTEHDGRMGTGKLLDSEPVQSSWEDVGEGGLMGMLWRYACRAK